MKGIHCEFDIYFGLSEKEKEALKTLGIKIQDSENGKTTKILVDTAVLNHVRCTEM